MLYKLYYSYGELIMEFVNCKGCIYLKKRRKDKSYYCKKYETVLKTPRINCGNYEVRNILEDLDKIFFIITALATIFFLINKLSEVGEWIISWILN
jgi:hypothetical protein